MNFIWPLVFVVQRVVIIAAVWFVARRYRKTHPLACRCVNWSLVFGIVATLANIFLMPSLGGGDMWGPASEAGRVLLLQPSAWLYLLGTATVSTLSAAASLLLAYAALGRPDAARSAP